MHGFLEEVIPRELRNDKGTEGISSLGTDLEKVDEHNLEDSLWDILQPPFVDAGGPTDTTEDGIAGPASVGEITSIQNLLEVDFTHHNWDDLEETTWEQCPGFYIVYKSNLVKNMPPLNG